MSALRLSLLALVPLAAIVATLIVALWPAKPLAVPLQADFVIAGVTIINPEVGPKPNQRIKLHAGRIESISDDSRAARDSCPVYRYPGAYVLPGLIDMHVHYPAALDAADVRLFQELYLDYGVTAVRDAGSFDGSILTLRARVASGDIAGPRIFACGPIIDGDPPTWPGLPGFLVVHNAAEAERAVDKIAAQGVNCVKAYQNLTPDALAGLRDAATRHHLPLIGHVPFAVPLERAHLDDVQHLTGVPSVALQRSRSSSEGLRELLSEWEGIDNARISEVVRISTEQHLVHTPTIIVIDQITRLSDYAALAAEPDAQLLPRWFRGLQWKPGGPFNAGAFLTPPPKDPARIRATVRDFVRALHQSGVTLHVGSDTLNPFVVPGASMRRELANFVESGFTREQALAAATWRNGTSLPEPGLGTIAPGAPGDLIVLRDDPTKNLDALSTLEAVVAAGRFYPKSALDAAVARSRAKFESFVTDHIGMAIFRFMLRLPSASQSAPYSTPVHL